MSDGETDAGDAARGAMGGERRWARRSPSLWASRSPSPVVLAANQRLRTCLTPLPPTRRWGDLQRPSVLTGRSRVAHDIEAMEEQLRSCSVIAMMERFSLQPSPPATARPASARLTAGRRQPRAADKDATVTELVAEGFVFDALERCRGDPGEQRALKRRVAKAKEQRYGGSNLLQRNVREQRNRSRCRLRDESCRRRDRAIARLSSARKKALALLQRKREKAASRAGYKLPVDSPRRRYGVRRSKNQSRRDAAPRPPPLTFAVSP